MSTIKVVSMTGAEVGSVELNDAIFGIEPNMSVVHEVVKNHLANCRQGTQSALTRAEVSGGGSKPWRQKGTGRARQGSTRAPQWTHGGIAFAPKPRSYSYVLNKKVKRLALKSVLSAKAAQGEIVVVDKIALDEIKTKDFQQFPDRRQGGRQGRCRDSRGQRGRCQERPQHARRRHHRPRSSSTSMICSTPRPS